MRKMLKILVVTGARPNFMKVAPLLEAMGRQEQIKVCLVHTGQHYDRELSTIFFDQLRIPRPAYELGVGSGSHATQTAEIMKRFEPVCKAESPDLVVVVGDVNSTLACALVAAKLAIRVAHVEAGLRSFDRTMPEEINRVLTDVLADYLFTTEVSANRNLVREGVDACRIFFVGNVMIDTLHRCRAEASVSRILTRLKLKESGSICPYGIVTLHRPNNVDDPEVFAGILSVLDELAQEIPLVFPVHPRTQGSLKAVGRPMIDPERLDKAPGRGDVLFIEPLGYLDFLCLLDSAQLVLTDSGGIQEEATVLGVPCVTLRTTTERPVTLDVGLNVLAGSDPEEIVRLGRMMLNGGRREGVTPPLWDGHASERIVDILIRELLKSGVSDDARTKPEGEQSQMIAERARS